MEIKSTQVNQNNTASQLASAKSSTLSRQPEPKAPTAIDKDGDSDNSKTSDNVSLSAESLKLAKTSTVQNTKSQAVITDRQQAQQLTRQMAADIQAQPNQAQNAFGRISQTQASALLI